MCDRKWNRRLPPMRRCCGPIGSAFAVGLPVHIAPAAPHTSTRPDWPLCAIRSEARWSSPGEWHGNRWAVGHGAGTPYRQQPTHQVGVQMLASPCACGMHASSHGCQDQVFGCRTSVPARLTGMGEASRAIGASRGWCRAAISSIMGTVSAILRWLGGMCHGGAGGAATAWVDVRRCDCACAHAMSDTVCDLKPPATTRTMRPCCHLLPQPRPAPAPPSHTSRKPVGPHRSRLMVSVASGAMRPWDRWAHTRPHCPNQQCRRGAR